MLILNVTHKPNVLIHNSIIKGMYVGAYKEEIITDKRYLLDSKGICISEKNANYNELTALYYLWKNKQDEDIVGLNHYRRYLDVFKPSKKLFSRLKRDVKVQGIDDPRIKKISSSILFRNQVNKVLENNDVILPIKTDYSHKGKYPSLADDYCNHHCKKDWAIMIDVLLEKYPEYKNSVDIYLYKSSMIYGMNLFIATYKWTNKYCEWLFDILFEVEKRIKLSKDPYQKRVFGFMSERLMTLYVMHNCFNVFETQVLNYNK